MGRFALRGTGAATTTSFGQMVRGLREAAGLSQADLGRKLGWKQGKVSYIESRVRVPAERDLLPVCDYFGVTPELIYVWRRSRRLTARNVVVSRGFAPGRSHGQSADVESER